MSYRLSPSTGLCHWSDSGQSETTHSNGTKGEVDVYDLLVEKARKRFVAFLASDEVGVNVSDFPKHYSETCYNYYLSCLFADAQVCVQDEISSWKVFKVYTPFAIVLVLTAIIFNGLSFYFLTKNRTNRLPRHGIIKSLSFSDPLLSLFTLGKRSLHFLPQACGSPRKMPFLLCNSIWQICWINSALSVLMLSLDCFFATRFPYFYRRRKVRVGANILTAGTWLFASLVTLLLTIFNLAVTSAVQYSVCSVMLLILVVVVVGSIYVFSVAEGVRRQQERYFYSNRFLIRQLASNRLRSVITILMIVVCTYICWLPLLVFFLLPESVHAAHLEASNMFLAVCLICFHVNGITNPIIYSFRFRDVRGPMRKAFSESTLLKPIGRLLGQNESTVGSLGDFFQYTSRVIRHRNSEGHFGGAFQRRRSWVGTQRTAIDTVTKRPSLPTSLTPTLGTTTTATTSFLTSSSSSTMINTDGDSQSFSIGQTSSSVMEPLLEDPALTLMDASKKKDKAEEQRSTTSRENVGAHKATR